MQRDGHKGIMGILPKPLSLPLDLSSVATPTFVYTYLICHFDLHVSSAWSFLWP